MPPRRADRPAVSASSVPVEVRSRSSLSSNVFRADTKHAALRQTLFRLWDVFFVEGFDVFFRAAVAVLKVNEDALMACDSIGVSPRRSSLRRSSRPDPSSWPSSLFLPKQTLYESLEACTSRLWSPDQLLAVRPFFRSSSSPHARDR